jgi:hypothetical protein
MSKEAKSSLVLMYLSTVSVADALSSGASATRRVLVCEEDSSWSTSASIGSTATKCGTFQVPDAPAHTLSGKGVAVGQLATNEASAQQLKIWCDATQSLYFAYRNAASSPLTEGEVLYITGSGYFSKVGATANQGDGFVKFDWEFTVSGAADLTV